MKDTFFMAIDLGTTYIKVGIYDRSGICYAKKQTEVEIDNTQPGIFVQSGDSIYESVLSCIKETAEEVGEIASSIAAIGFTGQMAGFMGVDENWKDLTSWSCSLDTRYVPWADEMLSEYRQEFLEIGGTNAPLMAPKCKWFVETFPEKAEKVVKYMMISSYIIGRMGKCPITEAVIDCSYLTWTGLADMKKSAWSQTLCRNANILRSQLPRIVRSNEICGRLSEEAADRTGLVAGIPLVSGAGDKIAGCIGSGILSPGSMVFEASSYGAISCMAEDFRPNLSTGDYDAIPAFEPGNYYLHKYLPGSGITLSWFLDLMEEKQGFEELEKRVAKVPCGCEGLMAVGLLGGSAMPFDGEIKGMWIGHTWSHKKEHFYRALLESYGYELADTLDSIRQMYPELEKQETLFMIGGGSQSAVWPEMIADITGKKVVLFERSDLALWGTAILAGNAVGVFEDMREIVSKTVHIAKEIEPNPERYKKYKNYRNVYRTLKEKMRDVCMDLTELSK